MMKQGIETLIYIGEGAGRKKSCFVILSRDYPVAVSENYLDNPEFRGKKLGLGLGLKMTREKMRPIGRVFS